MIKSLILTIILLSSSVVAEANENTDKLGDELKSSEASEVSVDKEQAEIPYFVTYTVTDKDGNQHQITTFTGSNGEEFPDPDDDKKERD